MKRLLMRTVAFTLVMLLFVTSGCIERFPGTVTDHYTGDPITPEDIDSIFEAISVSVTEKYPAETDSDGNLIVYWLKNGSVWHESSKCGTVLNAPSESLFVGTPYDAYCAGKERACKVCSHDSKVLVDTYETTAITVEAKVTEETVKYPKEYDLNGELIVYWLKNGTVWHESSKCGTVSKASPEDLYIGTPYDAFCAGKDRACKVCSSDSQVVIDVQDITTALHAEDTTAAVEKYPKEYDTNGELIVFWLESGTVWHESLYCSVLSDVSADRILSGSVSEAIVSSKERACKKCSQ